MHTVLFNSNKRRSSFVDEKRRSFVVNEKSAKLEPTISLADVLGLQQLGVLQHDRQDHRLDAGFPVAVFACCVLNFVS